MKMNLGVKIACEVLKRLVNLYLINRYQLVKIMKSDVIFGGVVNIIFIAWAMLIVMS